MVTTSSFASKILGSVIGGRFLNMTQTQSSSEKNMSQRESRGFPLGTSTFPPTGKVDRVNWAVRAHNNWRMLL